MKILRFLLSRSFLFVLGVTAFVSWTIDVWSSGSLGTFLHNAARQEFFNLVVWVIAVVALAIYAAIKTVKSAELSEVTADEYYGIAIFVALAVVALLSSRVMGDPAMGGFATLMGAAMATGGWLTSAWLTVRNQIKSTNTSAEASRRAAEAAAVTERKRHTLNILVEMRQNAIFNMHRDNLVARFPPGATVTVADVTAAETEMAARRVYTRDATPLISESLRYVANYYEFLCAALRQQDLDEVLLRETHRQILTGFFERLWPFIEELRKKNGPKTYEHFQAVVEKWNTEDAVAEAARQP